MTKHDLKAGMVVTDGDKCHDGTTQAVFDVVDDDGILMLRCRTCRDEYAVSSYPEESFTKVN